MQKGLTPFLSYQGFRGQCFNYAATVAMHVSQCILQPIFGYSFSNCLQLVFQLHSHGITQDGFITACFLKKRLDQ